MYNYNDLIFNNNEMFRIIKTTWYLESNSNSVLRTQLSSFHIRITQYRIKGNHHREHILDGVSFYNGTQHPDCSSLLELVPLITFIARICDHRGSQPRGHGWTSTKRVSCEGGSSSGKNNNRRTREQGSD